MPQGTKFGLHNGQCRGNDMVHNGGWYNQKGEKLGWGDLSPDDAINLMMCLLPGEVFVVLPESASFWDFVTKPGLLGSNAQTKPDIEAPGQEYVMAKCQYIFLGGLLGYGYFVSEYNRPGDTDFLKGDARFRRISREEANLVITTGEPLP